jgi:uncharacterized protein (TIGR03437 family)
LVTAKIAGVSANVTYAGAAPGLPGGVVQINIRIPEAVRAGDALGVSLSAGNFTIPDGVTISIR